MAPNKPRDSRVETDPQALAEWLRRFRAVLEDEGGDTEAGYVVAEFDAAKNFYIRAISEHCEVVSRANAPELTEAQEATLRQRAGAVRRASDPSLVQATSVHSARELDDGCRR